MYTDEPAVKKDVASGQNFSRFSLLTKITVFRLLRNPTSGNRQGSWLKGSRKNAHSIRKGPPPAQISSQFHHIKNFTIRLEGTVTALTAGSH
jgi:hypothetical protein